MCSMLTRGWEYGIWAIKITANQVHNNSSREVEGPGYCYLCFSCVIIILFPCQNKSYLEGIAILRHIRTCKLGKQLFNICKGGWENLAGGFNLDKEGVKYFSYPEGGGGQFFFMPHWKTCLINIIKNAFHEINEFGCIKIYELDRT